MLTLQHYTGLLGYLSILSSSGWPQALKIMVLSHVYAPSSSPSSKLGLLSRSYLHAAPLGGARGRARMSLACARAFACLHFSSNGSKHRRLRLIWSRTHLIPGLPVPHFLSPWTNGPKKFGPQGQMVPNQFGPPGQTVPIKVGPHGQMVVCPGGQEVGDRKSRDRMGSGPNASQPLFSTWMGDH